MQTGDENFRRLINANYDPAELVNLDRLQSQPGAYAVEPINPGREELLLRFDQLLMRLIEIKDAERAAQEKARFISKLTASSAFKLSMPIKIGNIASYINEVPQEQEVGVAVLAAPTDLFGDFSEIHIGPWFDISRDDESEDQTMYERDNGLMVAVSNAQLHYADGEVEELTGFTYVPLNHGTPNLYHVLRS